MRNLKIVWMLIAALTASVAVAAGYRSFQETQILTRAAPTLATEGMSLAGVTAYRVALSANAAQTISGGTLLCDLYLPALARWVPCGASFTLTPTTGARDYVSAGINAPVGAGRILYRTSSVTVSGGTTVVLTIEATTHN